MKLIWEPNWHIYLLPDEINNMLEDVRHRNCDGYCITERADYQAARIRISRRSCPHESRRPSKKRWGLPTASSSAVSHYPPRSLCSRIEPDKACYVTEENPRGNPLNGEIVCKINSFPKLCIILQQAHALKRLAGCCTTPLSLELCMLQQVWNGADSFSSLSIGYILVTEENQVWLPWGEPGTGHLWSFKHQAPKIYWITRWIRESLLVDIR